MSDRPLTILHLTLASDAGGLSEYICSLAAACARRGHRIAVAGDTGAWQWRFDQSPLEYITVPLKAGLPGFFSSVALVSDWMKRNAVDVIHTHYRRATLLGRRVQRRSNDRRRLPLLYTLHLSHISLKFPRRLLTDFGDHTHVASVMARDWLRDDARVPESRIHLIPHGVDTDRFNVPTASERRAARAALGIGDDATVATYVGRLDDPKNEAWMLDVAEQCRATSRALRVLLVGEGPHETSLRASMSERGLGDVVSLLGHRDPRPIYHATDLLCLPSGREGFSLVCAEAMSTGVPILRTRTSGYDELVLEGRTGVGVDIDRDAFTRAACELLGDRDTLRTMGERAASLVREKYTFDQQVERTLALYERLATQRS